MAAKDFSKVRCPSCGMLGTLHKKGSEAVCHDHLCGNAFPITKSGAFLWDAKKKPSQPDQPEKPPAADDPVDPDVAPPEDPADPVE